MTEKKKPLWIVSYRRGASNDHIILIEEHPAEFFARVQGLSRIYSATLIPDDAKAAAMAAFPIVVKGSNNVSRVVVDSNG